MKRLLISAAILALVAPAFAQTPVKTAPPHPPVVTHPSPETIPPNDATAISLTFGDLKALVAAQLAQAKAQEAQAAAASAERKLQDQLAPKPEKKP